MAQIDPMGIIGTNPYFSATPLFGVLKPKA